MFCGVASPSISTKENRLRGRGNASSNLSCGMATFARSGSSLSIERGAWIDATVSSIGVPAAVVTWNVSPIARSA